jgi:hypothetical protein
LATGQFQIHGVLDGAYRLRVFQAGDGGQLLFADQDVVVKGRDVEGVEITVGAAPAVRGTLRVHGSGEKPEIHFLAFLDAQDSLLALSGQQKQRVSGEVTEGRFDIPSVFPGKYWTGFSAGDGFYVSSARAGDTDLLAAQELFVGAGATPEIEVTLRADGGSVTGTVAADAAGDVELVALLVAESCNRPADITAAVPGGEFSFLDVAPGTYRLHAGKESAEVEFGSPKALCALARSGVRVEVRAGDATTVQLQKLSEEPK